MQRLMHAAQPWSYHTYNAFDSCLQTLRRRTVTSRTSSNNTRRERQGRGVRELCHGSNVVPGKQADLGLADVVVVRQHWLHIQVGVAAVVDEARHIALVLGIQNVLCQLVGLPDRQAQCCLKQSFDTCLLLRLGMYPGGQVCTHASQVCTLRGLVCTPRVRCVPLGVRYVPEGLGRYP